MIDTYACDSCGKPVNIQFVYDSDVKGGIAPLNNGDWPPMCQTCREAREKKEAAALTKLKELTDRAIEMERRTNNSVQENK